MVYFLKEMLYISLDLDGFQLLLDAFDLISQPQVLHVQLTLPLSLLRLRKFSLDVLGGDASELNILALQSLVLNLSLGQL